jgi:PD-(D/E)XK nuclease superfamily
MPIQDIHITDVQTFKACRRKWDYSSTLRQGLERKAQYAPFYTGRAIHSALEAYYANGMSPTDRAIQFFAHAEQEMKQSGAWARFEAEALVEQQLTLGMLEYYLHWVSSYKGDYADGDLDFVSLETAFRVPLHSRAAKVRFNFAGRFDGVVRHKPTQTLWLFETKTTRSFDEFDINLDRIEQLTAYVWAAQECLAHPVEGILMNVLRKGYPSTPKVLKNGYLSKAKSQDCPADFYLAAIHAQHKDVLQSMSSRDCTEWIKANYGDILEALLISQPEYIKRIPVRKTPQELATFMSEFVRIGREMLDRPVIYRTESQMGCKFCQFRIPCSVAKSGGDEEGVLFQDFKTRTYESHALVVENGEEAK